MTTLDAFGETRDLVPFGPPVKQLRKRMKPQRNKWQMTNAINHRLHLVTIMKTFNIGLVTLSVYIHSFWIFL